MELALYDPSFGFFAAGGAAGRRGDFVTSPEIGPLFGAVVAGALDTWWVELGRPDPYVVVEAGAGVGTLATAVSDAVAACAPALHYVMVERSDRLRERQATSATWTSLPELPAEPGVSVVLANELLDNLPCHLLERCHSPFSPAKPASEHGFCTQEQANWREVRVGEERSALVEVLVPASPESVAEAEELAPDAVAGARIPLQLAARSWLQQALALVQRGRVVVIDYADITPSLAARPASDWLRTYRAHARGSHPLHAPGTQDITCEVALDQLARVRAPTIDRTQAEFLRSHGIEELTGTARATWQERAHLGDLTALKARSRVSEAAALTDPDGLGAFRVLEWDVG